MFGMEYELNLESRLWIPRNLKDSTYFEINYSFSLPLMVENPDYEEFPYHFIGSCFLINRNGKTYVVTAKHCIEDTKTNPNNLFVLRNLRSRECLPLCHSYSPKEIRFEGQILNDKNQLDFIIYEVEQNPFKDFYPLAYENKEMYLHNEGEPLFNLSYPFIHNSIDYGINKIKLRQRFYKGTYNKKEDDFTHLVQFENENESLNGASGSPVLVGIPGDFKLTGILTRDDEKNLTGIAAYLDVVLVGLAIDQHDPQNNSLTE